MKKKILYAVAILSVALVAFGTFKGYEYYNNRYVGTDYYYKITAADQPLEQKSELDGTPEYKYTILAYDKNGKSHTITFRRSSPYPEGTYLRVTASQQLSLSELVVERQDVPAKALVLID